MRGDAAKWKALAQAEAEDSDPEYGRGLAYAERSDACLTCPRLGCLCLCCVAVPAILVVIFALCINSWVAAAVENVGVQTFGVPTTVGSVDVSLLRARWSVNDLKVASPEGFGPEDFMRLDAGVVDMGLSSLLSSPLELEELALHNLHVSIDQHADGDSNAKRIMNHVDRISQTAESKQFAERMMHTKVTVDRVSFHNISARLCLHPSCDLAPPGQFLIKQVSISNVGKKSNGINVPDLLQIIVRAVITAAIRVAPLQLGSPLAQSLGNGLLQALDYAQIHYDVGHGLQQAGARVGEQLGLLSKGTQEMGSGVADSLEQSESIMIGRLDKALGLENPTDEGKARAKELVNANAQAMATAVVGALRKGSTMLGQGEQQLGNNVSESLAAVGNMVEKTYRAETAGGPPTGVGAIGAPASAAIQKPSPLDALRNVLKNRLAAGPGAASEQPSNPLEQIFNKGLHGGNQQQKLADPAQFVNNLLRGPIDQAPQQPPTTPAPSIGSMFSPEVVQPQVR